MLDQPNMDPGAATSAGGSSAIPAIASAGGQAVNSLFGYLGQREANEVNRDLAHDARIYNEQMWNKQNEYNDYAHQIQRMLDAGLNPRLMYGQASSSNAGSVPAAPVAHVENALKNVQIPDLLEVLDRYQDYRLKGAQVDNLETWKYNQETEKNYREYVRSNESLKNDILTNQRDYSKALYSDENIKKMTDYQVDAKRLSNELNEKEILLKGSKGDQAALDYMFNKALNDLGVTRQDELYQRVIALFARAIGIKF